MKTTIMMWAMALVTLLSTNAFAQLSNPNPERPDGFDSEFDLRPAQERYDYDTGLQLGAGFLGGFAGATLGGAGGFVFGSTSCRGGGFSCIGAGIIEGTLGGVVFGTVGAAGAVVVTGGRYADEDDTFGAFAGGALGLVIGAPIGALTGISVAQFLRPDGAGNEWDIFCILLGTGITGFGAGLGASLGYQDGYNDSPIIDLAITPMLDGEHNGLVLSGRF